MLPTNTGFAASSVRIISVCVDTDKLSMRSGHCLATGSSTDLDESNQHEEGYVETPPGRKRARRCGWEDIMSNDSGSSGSLSPRRTLVPSPSSAADRHTEIPECIQRGWLPQDTPARYPPGIFWLFPSKGNDPLPSQPPDPASMDGDPYMGQHQAHKPREFGAPSIHEEGAKLLYSGVNAAALAARSLGRVMLLQAERERLRKRLQVGQMHHPM
jgi:hypothetical protein